MKQFIVTVTHDKGNDMIEVTAASEDAARLMILRAEGCPKSAVIKVKELTGISVTQYGDEHFLFDHDTQTIITHL